MSWLKRLLCCHAWVLVRKAPLLSLEDNLYRCANCGTYKKDVYE